MELRELNKGRESLGVGQGGRARRQEKVPPPCCPLGSCISFPFSFEREKVTILIREIHIQKCGSCLLASKTGPES